MQENNSKIYIAPPILDLAKVFTDIKVMQKDNLSDLSMEVKEEKTDEEVKGLKFISKKLKILLEKNKRIQYNDASRILINNFASAEKDQRNIKRRVYDAINVLVAANVVTKENNKIQLVNIKQRTDFDYQTQSKLLKKIQLLEKLKKKLSILEKITERNKEKGQLNVESKMICFDKKIKQVKMNKKSKKNMSITIKGVKDRTILEDFGSIVDNMV